VRTEHDEAAANRHAAFDNSVSVGRPIAGKLSLYGEVFSSISTQPDAPWIGTTNTWLTYEVNDSMRIDGGVYIGITESADKLASLARHDLAVLRCGADRDGPRSVRL
jgi:hypothetical protein